AYAGPFQFVGTVRAACTQRRASHDVPGSGARILPAPSYDHMGNHPLSVLAQNLDQGAWGIGKAHRPTDLDLVDEPGFTARQHAMGPPVVAFQAGPSHQHERLGHADRERWQIPPTAVPPDKQLLLHPQATPAVEPSRYMPIPGTGVLPGRVEFHRAPPHHARGLDT